MQPITLMLGQMTYAIPNPDISPQLIWQSISPVAFIRSSSPLCCRQTPWLPPLTYGCHSADGGVAARSVSANRHLALLLVAGYRNRLSDGMGSIGKARVLPSFYSIGGIRDEMPRGERWASLRSAANLPDER